MLVILVYLIFQTFFRYILYIIGDIETLDYNFLRPEFHLWYVVSLSFWYLLAILLNKLNLNTFGKLSVFIILLGISFISRWYTDGIVEFVQENYYEEFTSYTLSYQRTLSFMPFFFAGFFMTKNTFTKIYSSIKNIKIGTVLFICSMFLVFLIVNDFYGIEALYRGSFGTYRFLDDGQGVTVYITKVISHYIIAGWLCYLIMNLASNKKSIFTKWGDHSLTIFIFHPLAVFLLRQTEFMSDWTPNTKLAAFLLISIPVTWILGSNNFVKGTKYICNPYNFFIKMVNHFKPANDKN